MNGLEELKNLKNVLVVKVGVGMMKKIIISLILLSLIALVGCNYQSPIPSGEPLSIDIEDNDIRYCGGNYNYCLDRFSGCMDALEIEDNWSYMICDDITCEVNPIENPCMEILDECEEMCED